MSIRLFVTGGTFDKEYDEIHGRLYFQDTHLPEMLEMGRCRVDVEIRTLMLIDSLDMSDADRELIARQCRDCPEDRIVVTHGTDTMVDTAALLAREVPDKTIVLTGAMIPIAFGSSDGLFNLGGALAVVQVLEPGVYVVMNGCVFNWDAVRKNRETGVFEEVDPAAQGASSSRTTRRSSGSAGPATAATPTTTGPTSHPPVSAPPCPSWSVWRPRSCAGRRPTSPRRMTRPPGP
jgi:L-asparaginase